MVLTTSHLFPAAEKPVTETHTQPSRLSASSSSSDSSSSSSSSSSSDTSDSDSGWAAEGFYVKGSMWGTLGVLLPTEWTELKQSYWWWWAAGQIRWNQGRSDSTSIKPTGGQRWSFPCAQLIHLGLDTGNLRIHSCSGLENWPRRAERGKLHLLRIRRRGTHVLEG